MYTCPSCEKTFSRRDNMLRHKKTMHTDDRESDTMSISDKSESDNGVGIDSDDGSDLEKTNSGGEEYENPWDQIIKETFIQRQPEYEENVCRYMQSEDVTTDVARRRIFRDMKGMYRKTMTKIFSENIMWINSLLIDPIYKTIKKTASDLKVVDDYDSEEAWKYAINSRKYLYEKILNRYEPPEVTKPMASRQTGGGGEAAVLPQNKIESSVQKVERWANSELERMQNKPNNLEDTRTHDATPRLPAARNFDAVDNPDPVESQICISDGRQNLSLGITLKSCQVYQQHEFMKCQHFLEKIKDNSIAKQMKIKNGDELLLLNGKFVPFLSHTEVLSLFHEMKVDGQSLNKLVVRRIKKNRKVKWYELFSILSPGSKIENDVTVLKPKCQKVKTWSKTELEVSEQVYKVPGSQLYLVVDQEGLGTSTCSGDKSDNLKVIQKRTIMCIHGDGEIHFDAALRDKAMSRYISIDTVNGNIVLTGEPQWFKYNQTGDRTHFMIKGFYLGYDHGENEVKAQKAEFRFEEQPLPSHLH